MHPATNVLGNSLASCSFDPVTGYHRDGSCANKSGESGIPVICCRLTDDFLDFLNENGSDLRTPLPRYHFPGLRAGDQWCIGAERWAAAVEAGCACPIVIEATHSSALDVVDLETLQQYAITAD